MVILVRYNVFNNIQLFVITIGLLCSVLLLRNIVYLYDRILQLLVE
ncbi:hypothetical protein fep_163 [Pigeonpox virus]|uniref:Uncharacterized protein n=1 Tax=Pigeonpox virus TaxID=10264 RepID=A0A068EKY8_9POXV|nr:hypothetical protein HM89_gp165 [Pigeonpox virus]AID46667.1 hypothetical protein fep_163 [Pigeonpox virus]WCL40108.1 hypothetical protein [Pigeonpox virus]WIK87520.1 hypothetical protein TDPV-222 [Oriental turtle dovepox virus]